MSFDGAIFDLDGTLLDSMIIWDTLGDTYLTAKGRQPAPSLKHTLKTMSLAQAARLFATDYGIAGTVDAIMGEINEMIDHFYRHEAQFKPGAGDFLHTLHQHGVRLAVATATDRPLVTAALDRLGALELFQGIATCNEVGAGKDRPDVFEQALEQLGTAKARTLVFEDALHAIETACRAGFRVVGVHDDSSGAEQAQIEALCERYLTNYSEWGHPV